MDVEELVDLAARHPGLAFPEPLVRAFLTRMRRSEEHVVALRDDAGALQLAAVLLDTIDNSSEAAEIVILGRGPGAGPELVGRALDRAEALTLAGPRRRLLVALPRALADLTPLVLGRGFEKAFTLYEMETALPVTPPAGARRAQGWRRVDEDSVAAYAALTRRAFAGIPGASFPSLEDMRRNALAAELRPELLFDGAEPIAFARVSVVTPGDTSSVDLIGREPGRRGTGLGDAVMAHALDLVAATGARRAVLSVAAVNARARGLYERWGFRVTAEEPTYLRCW